MNDFNCFNIHYCSFFARKYQQFMFVFFSSIFQDRAVVANLKYFGYKTVTDVLLPLKEMKKRRNLGRNCFRKNMLK